MEDGMVDLYIEMYIKPAYTTTEEVTDRAVETGDTVNIDYTGYIDGEVLNESYGREVMKSAGLAADPIELKEDEYFVLGDNRNSSEDSRSANIGPVRSSDILGRVWFHMGCDEEGIGFVE